MARWLLFLGVAGLLVSCKTSTSPRVVKLESGAHVEPQSPLKLPEIDVEFQRFVLSNGLTLIVHEDHTNPLVAVNVWYHVGSKDEAPGRTGFAHLFEHLMFQGSENHHGEYFEPLERAGATDLNGTTNRDRTNYFQTVPTPALDTVLWMESDRMGHFKGAISQALLDEQRGVVQNEMRQGQNRPYGQARFVIPANTYPAGHPYSWPVIGSIDDLNAASLEDVKAWFGRYYGAANATIVIAGDITPEDALKRVETYFGDIAPGESVDRRGAWVAKMEGRRELTLRDTVPQERIYMVFNLPENAAKEVVQLELAARILGGGKNARLYKELVYDAQIATGLGSYVSRGDMGSQLVIWADAKEGVSLETIEEQVNQVLGRFLVDGPTQDELDRAKMKIVSTAVLRLERVGGFGGKSDLLARSQVHLGDAGAYKEQYQWLREARPDTVRQTAWDWLSDGRFVLKILPEAAYAAKANGEERGALPGPGAAPSLRFPAIQRATLSNGLQVVLAERHTTPIVRFRFVSGGGFATDADANLGLAKLAMDVLDEGTADRSSLELAAELERLGASLSSGATLDACQVSMSSLTSTLADSLGLFVEVLTQPAFAPDEIERRRALAIAAIRNEEARPFSMALRLLGPLLFGEHPYGKPLTGSGTEETVSGLNREQLIAFQQAYIQPGGSSLLVVGDTTMEVLVPLLESKLGHWTAKAKLPPKVESPKSPGQTMVYLVDKPGAEQSLVVVGNAFGARDEQDAIAVEAMNAVIGGSFMSRINMNLREDKHWSYGARSFVFETQGPQLFGIYARVQTGKTGPSIQEIQQEVDAFLGSRPTTADELDRVIQNTVRRLPGANESTSRVLSSIAKIERFGLGDDYFATYVERFQAIDVSALTKAAKAVIRPSIWIIVGDLKQIEAPVRALGLGKVVVMSE